MFDKLRRTVGLGLNEVELYNKAYEKGVSLNDFIKASELFDDAARKATEKGNTQLAAQATANSRLYNYLATKDPQSLALLKQALNGVPQIERIGLQQEFMPTDPLRAEVDARMVETLITQTRDDMVRLRDLHKLASEKFQAIIRNPLITYEYVKSGMGHDDRADERFFFHDGLYHFYEAMIRKDSDPSAASDELSLATQGFRRANDQTWLQKVTTLLENWRVSRTCYLCHRKIQGYELHFSMCSATITPYTKRVLEVLKEDPSTLSLESGKIAVCTPCGTMVSFKAAEEAEKVRRELSGKLDQALAAISRLESRVQHLEGLRAIGTIR